MNLVLRADANALIGSGHVTRCLALGQACQDAGGRAVLAVGPISSAIEARLKAEGIEVESIAGRVWGTADASQVVGLARRIHAPWVVIDSHDFGTDYQRTIAGSGLRLLVVDDHRYGDFINAHAVLNQNAHAYPELYKQRSSNTELMLGTSYALLRRQFLKWAGWRREIPAVARNVLVTLGGGELGSVIFNVIQGIRQLNTAELEVVVVVGADNPQVPAIRANLAGQTFPARLEQNTVDMAQLMGWADVGITAGGGTSWEAAFMGLPDLVIIMAENQRPSAERLGTIGAAVNLGWHEKLSPGYITDVLEKVLRSGALREDMMHLGRNLVDGRGATRVLSYLQDHC